MDHLKFEDIYFLLKHEDEQNQLQKLFRWQMEAAIDCEDFEYLESQVF